MQVVAPYPVLFNNFSFQFIGTSVLIVAKNRENSIFHGFLQFRPMRFQFVGIFNRLSYFKLVKQFYSCFSPTPGQPEYCRKSRHEPNKSIT